MGRALLFSASSTDSLRAVEEVIGPDGSVVLNGVDWYFGTKSLTYAFSAEGRAQVLMRLRLS